MRIVIAGGGTGGHLFPGIAVAQEILRQRPASVVTFAGTARGIEARVLPRLGFTLDAIRSAGLKATSLAARARGLSLLPVSGVDAWQVVSRRKPHVVIGVGGYSSGPTVLAAAARRVPTLLLEQNAVPGLTNRLLARVVTSAALTFETTLSFFDGKGFVSGNPVRPEFFDTEMDRSGKDSGASGELARGTGTLSQPRPPAAPSVRQSLPRLLVFGGSQGAHAINMAMAAAAPALAARQPTLEITHQTGERDRDLVRDAYRQAGIEARVEPFLFDMAREMKAADLAVCRSGATTIAELTASARPAIFIPLPSAADDHQRINAEVLVAAGAATVLEQRHLTGASLAEAIVRLITDAPARLAMSRAARRLAHPDAAGAIVERVFALAERVV